MGYLAPLLRQCKNVVRERRKRSPAALPPKKDSGCSCPSPGLYPSCDSAGQQYSLIDSQTPGPSTSSTKSAQATNQRALAKEILCLGDSPGGPPAQGGLQPKGARKKKRALQLTFHSSIPEPDPECDFHAVCWARVGIYSSLPHKEEETLFTQQ